jgi:hypothetical protein
MSVSVAAGPRNQRYLHPCSFGAGVFICEADKGCKLAIELHPQFPILRHEPDLFDELTDAFRSFQSGMLVIEGFGKIHDLLTVNRQGSGAVAAWEGIAR